RHDDPEGSGLSARKRSGLDELGMGTNAKVILHFADRPQPHGGWNGTLTTDRPFFQTWQSSAGQAGRPSVITAYFGGRSGAGRLPGDIAHGPAPRAAVDEVIGSIQRGGRLDVPRLRGAFLGRAHLDHW